MKKLLALLALILVGVVTLMAYRAITVFEDRQPDPVAGFTQIRINEQDAVQRFSRALTFPTVSYDDRNRFDARSFRDFHEFLRAAFPLVHRQAVRTVVNDFSLVYHVEGSDPGLEPVLFMSHFDVVPVEEHTLNEWTFPPFSGTVADGVVWGRGSVDDKIGVMALLESLEALLADGFQPRLSLIHISEPTRPSP